MQDRAVGSTETTRLLETGKIVSLAERMLVAAQVVAQGWPAGFAPASPINFLLELFLAEEAGRCLSVHEIGRNCGSGERVVQRWIAVLAEGGYVETASHAVGLSNYGHQAVSTMLTRLHESQRLLD